ncbi:MAG: hypothetical protein HY069_03580 [Chlamydiia bacterium]|nr:hypothetical protein [Chlamydiia bacterium]
MSKQLKAKVAGLESQIDVLEAELIHLNEMLMGCGFPEGIKTLKETMQEVLSEQAS